MTRPITQVRPKKPYPAFPLTAHASGQWCKKIGGKRHYFGPWANPDAASDKYRREFPYLQAGMEPPVESIILADVLNAFDDDKTSMRDAGRISQRTYKEYIGVCTIIANALGNTRPVEMIMPLDLKRLNHTLALGKNGKPVSPVTHKRLLTFARMVFHFANEMLDCRTQERAAERSYLGWRPTRTK